MTPEGTVIKERRLEFHFSSSWHTIKYDEHDDYIRGIQCIQGTNAVDIAAAYLADPKTVYLIEIKDFKDYFAENEDRIQDGSLARKIVLKVRDTLAGLVGGFHCGNRADWAPIMEQIAAAEHPIKVVFWMETEEDELRPIGRAKSNRSVLTDVLKRQLRWLTDEVLVVCIQDQEEAALLPEMSAIRLSAD